MGGELYLLLGEVLAVVRARRGADVVELVLELGEVALHEREAELQCRVGRGGAAQREAGGDLLARLMQLEVASRRSAEDKREQGGNEQAGGDHRVREAMLRKRSGPLPFSLRFMPAFIRFMQRWRR